VCSGTKCNRVLKIVSSLVNRRSEDYQFILDRVLNGNVNLTCSYFVISEKPFSLALEILAAVVTNLHPSLITLSKEC
jgi:hypothetical protein